MPRKSLATLPVGFAVFSSSPGIVRMLPLPNGSKIVLLNLPGKQLYIRDYYCSKTSKTNYLFAPCDLSMLSGRLAEKYEIHFVDCIADRGTEKKCLTELAAIGPHAVIFLAGAVSRKENAAFLEELRRQIWEALLIGTGDIFLEQAEELLKQHPSIDAAILNFSTGDVVKYLQGDTAESMVVREGKKVYALPVRLKVFDRLRIIHHVPN